MDAFLDGPGLKFLWSRVKSLFGDTFVKDNDQFNVACPVRGEISQKDFDSLSDAEKKNGVYFIPGDDNVASIEDYDETGDDGTQWHIRKYPSGYCELSCLKVYTGLNFTYEWGSLFVHGSLATPNFPFPLTTKYIDMINGVRTSSSYKSFFTSPSSGGFRLDGPNKYDIVKAVSGTNETIQVYHFVTGRWKE